MRGTCGMRGGMRGLVGAVALAAALLSPAGAWAAAVEWDGTLTLQIGGLEPISQEATGIATVNGVINQIMTGTGTMSTIRTISTGHLDNLRLVGGIGIDAGLPVQVTNSGSISTVATLRIDGRIGTGTIAITNGSAVSPGAIPFGSKRQSNMSLRGVARLCVLTNDCTATPPPFGFLTGNSGASGLGVGVGSVGVGTSLVQVSIEAAPWQINTATVMSTSVGGAHTTRSAAGFVHGPQSATSSTVNTNGVVQLISPMRIIAQGPGFDGVREKISLFSTLTLRFTPEPGMLILLGSGIVGLVALGRSRYRR